jgi:ArsR family transcriptional regulator
MIDMTKPGTTSSKDANTDNDACCGGGSSRLDHNEATVLAGQLSAIADPVRIQMLSIIASSGTGEVCACDFVGPIGKSQPTISHHLKVLNEAGLIAGDKRGRWIWYRLAPGSIHDVINTLVDAVTDISS